METRNLLGYLPLRSTFKKIHAKLIQCIFTTSFLFKPFKKPRKTYMDIGGKTALKVKWNYFSSEQLAGQYPNEFCEHC